jgi:hypothetical protein
LSKSNAEKINDKKAHLRPFLLATPSALVRQPLLVAFSTRTRVVSSKHDLDVFESKHATVDVLLKPSQRAENDVVRLLRELKLDFRVVLGAASGGEVSSKKERGLEEEETNRRSQK